MQNLHSAFFISLGGFAHFELLQILQRFPSSSRCALVLQAGGLPDCSRRLSDEVATPPENTIQTTITHPEGMPDLSRWLSEVRRATPPEIGVKK